MNKIGENIKKYRKEAKLTQPQLASACGWATEDNDGQSRLSNYENGKRDPKPVDLQVLAKALNRPVSAFYGEEQYRNVAAGPETKGLVPLISGVQAGEWGEAIDLFEPYEADEIYPCPVPHGPHTYCLRVEGDSMTSPVGRSYPEGALIYVDPEQNGCASGDRVIAKRNGENGVTFKQLAKDGDRMYLKPLNPNHPPIFDEFRILGKVIGMWMDE